MLLRDASGAIFPRKSSSCFTMTSTPNAPTDASSYARQKRQYGSKQRFISQKRARASSTLTHAAAFNTIANSLSEHTPSSSSVSLPSPAPSSSRSLINIAFSAATDGFRVNTLLIIVGAGDACPSLVALPKLSSSFAAGDDPRGASSARIVPTLASSSNDTSPGSSPSSAIVVVVVVVPIVVRAVPRPASRVRGFDAPRRFVQVLARSGSRPRAFARASTSGRLARSRREERDAGRGFVVTRRARRGTGFRGDGLDVARARDDATRVDAARRGAR
tara:strand:- start:4310 stop:5134 length:825 start_codon:yes stop_codon:yes gene_type:complete